MLSCGNNCWYTCCGYSKWTASETGGCSRCAVSASPASVQIKIKSVSLVAVLSFMWCMFERLIAVIIMALVEDMPVQMNFSAACADIDFDPTLLTQVLNVINTEMLTFSVLQLMHQCLTICIYLK